MNEQKITGHSFLNPDEVLLQTGIARGKTVADLGCGSGYFVLPSARLVGSEGQVFGVDVLEAVLATIASKANTYNLTNIKLVRANVEVFGSLIGIHDQSIDLVIVVQLLSQSKKHQDIFKEIERIIANDGQLLVVDWQSDRLSISPDVKVRAKPAEVKKQAEAIGLQLEKEFSASPYHFGLLFKKN